MNSRLCVIVFLMVLTSCNSPMNHRIEGEYQAQEKREAMSFTSLSLSVQVQWLTGPVGSLKFENQLMVVIKDSSGNPVSLPDGMSLNFYATMPSMGHPMDDAGYFEDLGNGIYLNKSIRYSMSGDWQNELWIMDADLKLKDKVIWSDFF